MTNDYLIKKVFNSFLFVSIMAMVAATIGMLVDGIVIGQFLGQECVSSFGLASPVFILIAAVAGIFSNGGTSCCSNHIGRGEEEKIKVNFTVTCLASLIVGIVVMLICVMGSTQIAIFLGARDELIRHTSDYIRGIGLGGVFIILSQVVMYYVRTDNDSVLGFISVLFMTACNITLDIVFATVLKLGMFGMGLATSISYLVCLLVCMAHFLRKDNNLKFAKMSGGMQEFKDVFLTGIPSALNRACMTVRGIYLNRLLMALMGSIAVSALSVQNNVNQFLSSVTMGVGMTVMLMAGIFYGERDESALSRTLKVSLKMGVLLSTIVSVLVIIFARPIVGMFLSSSEEALALAVRSLRMFCLSLPFSLSCVVLLNFYQCTKNLFMANFICIAHGLVFVVLYSMILSPVIGTDGVWISFLLSEITTLVLLVVVIRFRAKKVPKSFADMMMISENFEPDKERMLNISIKNDMDQVMQLSSRIEDFCRQYSEDENKIEKLSLCIEEMAGNIVQHGFKDKKQHFIDIKIIMAEKEIIFRMRDDGIAFNPLQFEAADDTDKFGIAVVRKMAKEIEYKNAIGMNNLTIVL
ncbi:MAG: MATE family efflux transporter [Eubacteriales bacterium]|nr:MATE family efflux transporter [Eubacteriales bacterium]